MTSSRTSATGPAFRPSELLGLMRGAAPVSAGASDELERLIAAIGQDPRALELLDSDDDPGRRARGPALARRRRGRGDVRLPRPRRATGCSTASTSPSRYALELPDVLLRAIRVAVDGEDVEASDVDAADRRRPRPGPRGASGRVRRAARRGAPDLPAPRRARRLQRHLGLRADAPRRARGRAPARRAGADPRRRASHRRRLRRDVRAAARARTAPSADELAARAEYRATHTRQGRAAVARRSAASAARPVRPAAGRRARDARDRHRAGRRCSAAPRRRTRRTCCAGWRRAAASTKGRRAASPGPPSSTGSSRATCS